LLGHTGSIHGLRFVSDKTAVSASADTLLKVWNLEAGVCEGTLSGHCGKISDVAVTGDHAVSVDFLGAVKVWCVSEQRLVHTLSGHTGYVCRVVCDGRRIFTGGSDAMILVWDLSTGELLATLEGHASTVCQISPQLEAGTLVTGCAGGMLILWSLHDYSVLHTISRSHDGSVLSLDARDGVILTAGSEGTVKLWDLNTGTLVGSLEPGTQVAWAVSLGRAKNKTAITVSAQGHSPFPQTDGRYLDVSRSCGRLCGTQY